MLNRFHQNRLWKHHNYRNLQCSWKYKIMQTEWIHWFTYTYIDKIQRRVGISVVCWNKIIISKIEFLSQSVKSIESFAVELALGSMQIIIIGIYRPPAGNVLDCITIFESMLNMVDLETSTFVISGDFRCVYIETGIFPDYKTVGIILMMSILLLEDFSQLRICRTSPHPPSPLRSDHIYIKDTHSAEWNEKPCIRFFRILFFE